MDRRRALDAAIEAAIDAAQSVEATAGADLSAAAAPLIAAYPGTLLADETATWLAKPREALRARLTRTLQRLGDRLEQRGDWRSAAELYRRGLEADQLCEPFYRGLMRSLAALGDQAEALNAYRRCRDLLSILLGVKPADDTERLHQQIAAGRYPIASPWAGASLRRAGDAKPVGGFVNRSAIRNSARRTLPSVSRRSAS